MELIRRESNLGNVREGEHGKFQFINCLLIRESNAFTKYGQTLGPLLMEVSGGAGPVGPREC
jgi:hypothetical protein